MEENFSMEWNMEENFSMEWNMAWKIFGMEWKWNGRKLPVWNTEKSPVVPYHALFIIFQRLISLVLTIKKLFVHLRSARIQPKATQ